MSYWDWGFTREAPGQSALCRVCNQEIPKGQEAILLTTRHSNKFARLFIHPHCFPEKHTLIP
jgi:hypothetical protein